MRSSFLLAALPAEKTLCVAYVPSAVTSCRGAVDDDTFSSSVASPACFLISASTIGICTSEINIINIIKIISIYKLPHCNSEAFFV